MNYYEKLKDPRWQRKRLAILTRDDFACRDCRAKDKELHVHHCAYTRGEPWDTPDFYLLTLCAECHEHRQSLEHDLRLQIGHLCAVNDVMDIESIMPVTDLLGLTYDTTSTEPQAMGNG